MNTNTEKIIYWIATGLLCAIFLYSAQMYFRNYEMVQGFFKALNYPAYVVYPLAILKVLGVIAIVTKKSDTLKEWAYAGFFLDLVLATAAHYDAGHGLGLSAMAFIPWVVSYFMDRRLF